MGFWLALLCWATTWTSGELSAAEQKSYADSLWRATFATHSECPLAHVYRLLRVNGTVHAVAYHQVGVTGPLFTCDHYAWVGGKWVPRGPGADPRADVPPLADLQDGHTWKSLLGPLGLRSWPVEVVKVFLDVDKVQRW